MTGLFPHSVPSRGFPHEIPSPPPSGSVSITQAWIAAGGVPTANTIAALDPMFQRWKNPTVPGALPYISKAKYFNMMVGADLASCLLSQIHTNAPASMTNTGFAGADYSEATGLTGNGTTKHLDIGASVETILGGIATGGMGAYLRSLLATGGARNLCGSIDGSNIFRLSQSSTPAAFGTWGGTVAGASIAGQMPVGWNYLDRSGSARLDRYSAGVSVANTTTATTPAGNGLNVYLFAANNLGAANSRSIGPYAGFGIFETLTAEQALDLAQSIQDAQTILGRQV
jgi:hypothetical protein